ncbi:MAG: Sec-independent protein translocase protein TatB [Bauldia sp.]|nr:Sec-independent protein translocase protein TatB [Bauldia sp.]
MLDIGWTELLVIAMVAIVVVGPKDLPRLMRTVGGAVTKVRRMARDFQRQINDAIRDEELEQLQRDMAKTGRQLDSDIRRSLAVPSPTAATPPAEPASSGDASAEPVMTPLPRTREEALAAHAAREQASGGTVVAMTPKRPTGTPVPEAEAPVTPAPDAGPTAAAGGQP